MRRMPVKVFLFRRQAILLISVCLISVSLVFDQQYGCVLGERQQRSGKSERSRPANVSAIDTATNDGAINEESGGNASLAARNKGSKNETIRSRNLDDISNRLDSPAKHVAAESQEALANGDTRVPFWNIAHMINSISQIDLALSGGANGIETDVSFDARGVPIEAYHGFPCDCGRHCHFREDFIRFVRHLAQITNPPATSRLLLVLFDLKLKPLTENEQLETAGKYLAGILYENLYSNYERVMNTQSATLAPGSQPPLRVIISINHAKDLALVRAFIGHMRRNHWDFMSQQVGFDVGMNDNLSDISSMWDSLNGATFNIWQGDGLTNCANIVRGVERLKQAIQIRNDQGHFRKIYYWTADILYHIRSVLRLGIDALLTNQPQRVLQALNEPEFKFKYRLAGPYDNPFEQYWIRPSAWKMSVPTLNEAVETVQNLHKTSRNFIKTLPDGISAAIKKVHASII